MDSTLLPVPVLVTDTKPLLASVATALDAVRELRMGCAVSVATPVTASVPDKVALAPPMVPVSVGEADITTLPVPVMALLTNPLEASVNTAWLAVNEDKIGCAVNVATPVTANVPAIEALPANHKSLYFSDELPRSTVLVVFGANKEALMVTSLVGPSFTMGAPSPTAPPCV